MCPPSPTSILKPGMGWQEAVAFLLSPEAVELRPLLVKELVTGLDLAARDRARRLSARLRPEVREHINSTLVSSNSNFTCLHIRCVEIRAGVGATY